MTDRRAGTLQRRTCTVLAHLRRAGIVAAIVTVLAAYAFFASIGTFAFRRVPWQRDAQSQFGERYYAALAEGFLHGRLSMPYEPDARWIRVNPYDQDSRRTQGLEWEMWDATLYRGRFYLYFSPVPVLLFYIPFRLMAGAYPPDNLIAALAASWAFLMSVAFARRAIGQRSRVPFPIWVLLIGVGNVIPFTFSYLRTYEVAVTTGMALTASWAYMLLRYSETGRTRDAVWMHVWVALAIATRPNLIMLLAVALFSVRRVRTALWSALPLAIAGGLGALYNVLRFGNPFELGMTYQISYLPIWRHAPCSLCDFPEAMRFMNNVVHYVFWPLSWFSTFPYANMLGSHLEPALSFTSGSEQIAGVAALSPLTLIGSAIVLVLALRRGESDAGVRATVRVMAGAWLIVCGLSTCRWVTARYALDFMMLMTVAAVVAIERALAWLSDTNVRVRVLATLVAVVACATIVAGVLLGFSGPDGVFAMKWSALHAAR